MKRLLFLSPVFFFLGCLEYNLKLDFQSDGSCQYEARIQILESVYKKIESESDPSQNLPLLMSEKAFRQQIEAAGGRLISFTKESSGNFLVLEIKASFADSRQLFGENLIGKRTFERSDNQDTWTWSPGAVAESFSDLDEADLTQVMTQLEDVLKGSKINISLNAPLVRHSNMARVGPTRVFHYAYDKDLARLKGKDAINHFKNLLEPKVLQMAAPKQDEKDVKK